MAGPPPQWPFGGVAPPGVAASGAQWFAGFAGEAGTPQNPGGALAGEGARAGAAGAGPGGAAGLGGPGPSGSAGTSDAGGSAPGARVAKVRKPYTITKQRERWTDEEHERFLAALKLHGRAWRKIEEHIGTKSAVQIRSHAQKFFSKLQRETQRAKREGAETGAEGTETDADAVRIPPARPKRKPNHPYPRKAPENVRGGGGGKTSAAARDASANVLNAFGMASGHHNPMYPNPVGAMFNGAHGLGLGAQQQQQQNAAALAAFVAAARGGGAGSFFPDAGVGVPGANPFASASHNHTQQQQQHEILRAAAANAGGFGALFASNPMALAQMATQTAGAPQNVTPQMAHAAQAAQAQQFFAALAAVGGAMPGVGSHSAAVIAEPQSLVAAVPAEVQRPAARPTGDAAAAADVYAAMLAAAAAGPAAAPGAAAAAAAQGASTPLAGGGSGSAFKAFADPAAAGPGAAGAAGPSAEQMAALANVMLLFPDGGTAAGPGAEASAAKPEMPPAGSAPAMAPAEPHALAGAQPSAERIAGRQPVMAGKDAAGRRESSSEKGSGSGDDDGGSGSDRGGAGSGDRGGSGSGSGEGGSGQSAQTKASNGRGASDGRKSRGFESSSQREPSPPQPRR